MTKKQRGTDRFHSTACVSAAVCALCLLLAACGTSTEKQWQEQYDLGQQYLLDGDYEQAIVAFTAAIEIDPNAVDAYLGRAEAYLEGDAAAASQENLQLALSDYSAALELDDTLTDTYVDRGDVYAASGSDDDLAAAIQDYTSALTLNDTLADVYVSRGDVYGSMGTAEDLNAAVSDYESAMALDETISEAYLGAAGAYLLLYDYGSALDVLEDGASYAEDPGEIEEQLAYVEEIVSAEEEWKEDLIDTFAELEESPLSIGTEDLFGDELREFLSGLKDPVRWEGADEEWMLLYPSGYVYYGEMEDGLRSGRGIWLRCFAQEDDAGETEAADASEDNGESEADEAFEDNGETEAADASEEGGESEADEAFDDNEETAQAQDASEELLALFYVGEWADDYPNGQGQYYRLFRGGEPDADSWMIVCEMEFTDGKADGDGVLQYISDLSAEEPYSEECEIEAADGTLTALYEDDGQAWTALMDTVRFNVSSIFIPGAVNADGGGISYEDELAFVSDLEVIEIKDRWANISDEDESACLFLNYRKIVWTDIGMGKQSIQLEVVGAEEDETYTWSISKGSSSKIYSPSLDYEDYYISVSEDGLLTFDTDLKDTSADSSYAVKVEVRDSEGRYGQCDIYVAMPDEYYVAVIGSTIMAAESDEAGGTGRQLYFFTASGQDAAIVNLVTDDVVLSNDRNSSSWIYYSGDMVIPETITFNGTDYNVTSFSYSTFQSSTELTSVYIPSSIREIKNISEYSNPFEGCDSLKEIVVADGNTAYKTIDGALYSADGSTLYSYPCAAEATSYTIPSGTTAIGDTAFYHCWNLEEILTEGVLTQTYGGWNYFSEDGILYETYGYGCRIFAYPIGSDRTELVLPEYVTRVYGEALDGSALEAIDASAGTITMDLAIDTRISCLYLNEVTGGPDMTELEVGLTSMEDLSWLLDMPNLERLVIYITEYSEIDTDSLSQMSSLTYLGIVIDDLNKKDDSVIEEALNILYEALPDCSIISR